jgi:hypothetical protein
VVGAVIGCANKPVEAAMPVAARVDYKSENESEDESSSDEDYQPLPKQARMT